ncbi:MAG TPA: ribonuclease P protein component [Thermoanaerobaculia bacterium]|nr:ribonuclease P protein component [Thermoanaerobaculia bacterium]
MSAGEALPRSARIRRRSDYLRCYRRGRRRSGAFVILYAAPSGATGPRLGITVSRKVGNSVVRHRIKRRVVEVFRRWPGRALLPSLDLVVHVKPEAAGAGFAALRGELERLLSGLAEGRRA